MDNHSKKIWGRLWSYLRLDQKYLWGAILCAIGAGAVDLKVVSLLRPFLAVAIVPLLVATGLGINNFVAKHLRLLPLIWLITLLPGVAAAMLLFMPRALAPARLVRPGNSVNAA